MEDVTIADSELHEALFRSFIRPMVVADRNGRIVEWNHAAEQCIGLSREWAVGRQLWEVQAAVAPAAIPYERACETARDTFFRLVRQSDSEHHPWRVRSHGSILSAQGVVRQIRSEIFPVWIRHNLVIVSTLSDPSGDWFAAGEPDGWVAPTAS